MSDYKKKVKLLREKRGWSQGDLAKVLRVRQSTISRWENGLSHPAGLCKMALDRMLAKQARA